MYENNQAASGLLEIQVLFIIQYQVQWRDACCTSGRGSLTATILFFEAQEM